MINLDKNKVIRLELPQGYFKSIRLSRERIICPIDHYIFYTKNTILRWILYINVPICVFPVNQNFGKFIIFRIILSPKCGYITEHKSNNNKNSIRHVSLAFLGLKFS